MRDAEESGCGAAAADASDAIVPSTTVEAIPSPHGQAITQQGGYSLLLPSAVVY
jgi:hypothetical protein